MPESQDRDGAERGDCIPVDEFRRQISEMATSVAESGRALDIGRNAAKPVYRLLPLKDSSKEIIDRAMQIRVDEARRTFSEIGAILRVANGDAYFAIVVKGVVTSILQLHPKHKLKLVPRYEAFLRSRRNGGTDDGFDAAAIDD